MPEHKMVVIDGIRYRPEDTGRARARKQDGPLSLPHADPRARTQEPLAPADSFDPAKATIPAVLEYLADADEAETVRVLDLEAEGEKRSTLLNQREQLLDQARERADHGPAS